MFSPFLTTGIGSLPHTDPQEACRLVFATLDIPFWPQLPRISFRESMIPQFSEGLPSLMVDEKRETVWVEKEKAAAEKFFETYSADWSLAISEEYARGFHAFVRQLGDKQFGCLKGQITGPLTFTLGLKDSAGKPVYFDEELREISLIILKAKIKWQIEILKKSAPEVIIFIDEPILSALGSSSYLGVACDEAERLLRETSDSIKEYGGIPGIHCCGKADWPLVIRSGARIINFDAYDYLESVSLYPAEIAGFLRNDGYLAWGIVPTTDAIEEMTPVTLKRRFEEGIAKLSQPGVPGDLLLSRILLTPSCGVGSRSLDEAIRVFGTLGEVKNLLQEAYS